MPHVAVGAAAAAGSNGGSHQQQLPSPTYPTSAAAALPLSAIHAAIQSQLAQSLVRSRISSSPTLLPTHLAQLVTALSLCARVSLRASALFIEAIVESLQTGTATGLAITRRALIAAVGSARALHHFKEGLDWSGRDKDGGKSEDAFLQVLDKYTNLGIYLIHHTFTLAELFAMSGFYLTLNTISVGFSAAEESVRMLESILGSNESSRALSSIITLVRAELTREDPRFGPVGLLADEEEDRDEQQRKTGALSSITALTKALTAFACLQTATHRRTLRELKMRVVYDCTVVVEGQSTFSASSDPSTPDAPSTPPSGFDVTVDYAGRYAGPPAPPRVPRPSRRSSNSTLSTRTRESTTVTPLYSASSDGGGVDGGAILTDIRSELEARAARALASQPGTAMHSRRASDYFQPCEEGSSAHPTIPGTFASSASAFDLLDPRPENELMSELESLCGARTDRTHGRQASRNGAYEEDEEASYMTADESHIVSEVAQFDDVDEHMSDGEAPTRADELPHNVQSALRGIETRYAKRGKGRATSLSSGASTIRGSPTARARRGVHAIRSISGKKYGYEIEVEETTTTTTTTVRTVEETTGAADLLGTPLRFLRGRSRPRLPDKLVDELNSTRRPADVDGDFDAMSPGRALDDDWVEVDRLHGRRSEDSSEASRTLRTGDAEQDITFAANGAGENGRDISLAGRSRQEALEHPEESKQRLQIVLSTMTKKLTQRRRTVRRVLSGSGVSSQSTSRSTSHSPALGSGTGSKKRRWPRSSSRSASFSSTNRPVEDSGLDATSPVPVPSKSAEGRAKGVLRTLRRSWRTDRGPSTPPNSEMSSATSTVVSSDAENEGVDAQPTRAGDMSHSWSAQLAEGPSVNGPRAPPPEPIVGHSTAAQSGLTLPPTPTSPFAPSATSKRGVRHTTSMQTMRSTLTTTCHTASLPTDEPEPKSGNFPHAHLVSNLQHFARYASAAYGQSFLRILGIAKHEFKFPHTEIHANNHAFAHHVGIHVEDILLSSFTDRTPTFESQKMSPIVNYVAVDHSVKAIVLACRGSLGLSDILTDLTCSYEPIPVPDADPSGSYLVHSGMFCSATVLQRGTVHEVIRDALKQFPDYGLVLCGHSLGGGVAALLSILWSSPSKAFERYAKGYEAQSGRKINHPSLSTPFVTSVSSGLPPGRPISCFTYGVPCVASLDLVEYCRGLVVSTIHNYDLVPTLSLGVLRDFKSMAMGFYAEQGVCEEIVGRVIGLCQRRFMAHRAARKAPGPPPSAAPFPSAPPDKDELPGSEPLTDSAAGSRLVPFSSDEISAGRGANKALEPAYQDPSLLGADLVADDMELSDWLWSLRTTIRASSDNEKLYPPGSVYVVESYTVFISSESSASGQYSRREGRRVLLRAIDDVERRFSEPIFSRTMLSDHSPREYEANCDYLASAVV